MLKSDLRLLTQWDGKQDLLSTWLLCRDRDPNYVRSLQLRVARLRHECVIRGLLSPTEEPAHA